MDLAFSTTPTGTVTVIQLAGHLNNATVTEFDRQFLASNATLVVLDLAKLEYISSAGLRSILSAFKRVKAAGGNLVIAAAQPAVVEVFDISGFRALIPMHSDRAAAVAALA